MLLNNETNRTAKPTVAFLCLLNVVGAFWAGLLIQRGLWNQTESDSSAPFGMDETPLPAMTLPADSGRARADSELTRLALKSQLELDNTVSESKLRSLRTAYQSKSDAATNFHDAGSILVVCVGADFLGLVTLLSFLNRSTSAAPAILVGQKNAQTQEI